MIIEQVAPLVGAWIEIIINNWMCTVQYVAPLVGAWIEITMYRTTSQLILGRSSCRSVD